MGLSFPIIYFHQLFYMNQVSILAHCINISSHWLYRQWKMGWSWGRISTSCTTLILRNAIIVSVKQPLWTWVNRSLIHQTLKYKCNRTQHKKTNCMVYGMYCTGLLWHTVYAKKYAHGFVVLCFVVVMQSFIMNSHEVFIHIHQGCFAGTGAIVRLPQCQWSKPDGYGKISQCITTTKHSKAKTVCIFLGIYCR